MAREAWPLRKQSGFSKALETGTKKTAVFGILVSNPSDPFVSTHFILRTRLHLWCVCWVFELRANIMATSKHCATTSTLVIFPSPGRICCCIRQGMWRGWNGGHCGVTSVKKHDRFLRSEFLHREKIHTNVIMCPKIYISKALLSKLPSHNNKTHHRSEIPDQSQHVC